MDPLNQVFLRPSSVRDISESLEFVIARKIAQNETYNHSKHLSNLHKNLVKTCA